MLKIAVMGSGRGSNFDTIMREIHVGRISGVQVVLVISNNSSAGILDLARSFGVPSRHVSQKQFNSEDGFADRLMNMLNEHGVNFIVLAGYMKRLPSRLIAEFRNRIINIHPALLPRHGGPGMYGLRVHASVIASGDRVSGATVHIVDEEYDHGQIVLQRETPVASNETPESLAARVLVMEHEIYPEAIRMFAEGRVKIADVAVH